MRKNDTFDNNEEVRDFQLPDHDGPIPPDTKIQKAKGTWKALNIWAKVGIIVGTVLLLLLCAGVTGAADRAEERRETRQQERDDREAERQAEREAKQEERDAKREERREEREEAWSDDAWGDTEEEVELNPDDIQFLLLLSTDNYTEWAELYDHEQLYVIGNSVCVDFNHGYGFFEVIDRIGEADSDIHVASVPVLVGAAIATYCPEHRSTVEEAEAGRN